MNDYVVNDYFDWLYYAVKKELGRKSSSYRKLLSALHSIDFTYNIEYDENRAHDGKNLRWYYVDDGGDDAILKWNQPCSVLEMLIALAMKIENIMENPELNNNSSYWFWLMLDNIDLKDMTDRKFDKDYIHDRVDMFLKREYKPNGDGNIIYIENCSNDLRKVEIWYQMCWYLDSII